MSVPRIPKVLIDISSIPYGRGVSWYTSNLAQSLIEQKVAEVSLFGYSARQYAVLKQWSEQFGTRAKKHIWQIPPKVLHTLWQNTSFPKISWIDKQAEIFHAWDWQLAPIGSIPQVVTIHDLAYKLFPDTAHPKVTAMYDQLLQTLENHPEIGIIAVSESTKKDIVNLTSIPAEQVQVIYEALPRQAQYVPSADEIAQVKKSFPGNKPFLLMVGTSEPRKNMPRVIEAWQKVRDHFDLYIVGAKGWDNLPKESGLYELGYVSPEKLAVLYRLAHALVYVSLYEGFGLPILEAYFHGCPVITSKVSSMSEISGDGALLVDPYDLDAIAEACMSLEKRDSVQQQKRLQAMQKTLQTFSWDKAAAQTAQFYSRVIQGDLL